MSEDRVPHIEAFARCRLLCYCSIGHDHSYEEWRARLKAAERAQDFRARAGLIATAR